jgi:lipoate---protein ligase
VAVDDLAWEVVMPAPLGAHVQGALDEVLMDRLIAGRRGATLRFWEWAEPALVLGSHQPVANEVDLDEARRLGFVVARRMSGGGTMIVEPGRSVTYSIYVPESLVAGLSFVDSFARLDAWTVACLRDLGVPAAYRPINDIVSPEGKIGGAAQARRRGFVLHHTAIAHAMDVSIVHRLLRIGRPPVAPVGVRSADRDVSPLERWLTLDRDEVVAALAGCFERSHPAASRGALTDDELADARALAERKYARPEWIERL